MPLVVEPYEAEDGVIEDPSYALALTVLAHLDEHLAHSGLPVPNMMVLPGNQAILDYCGPGDCGQAWVRLVSENSRNENGSAQQNPCASFETLYLFEVGVSRCAPTYSEDGKRPPTADEQLAAARIQLADMGAIKRTIQGLSCDKERIGEDARISLLTYQPLGGGDCVGGAWQFSIW